MAAAAGAGAVATSPFVVLGEALASLSAIQAEQYVLRAGWPTAAPAPAYHALLFLRTLASRHHARCHACRVAVLAKLAKLMPELSRLTSVDARVSGRKRKNRVEKDPDAPRRPPNGCTSCRSTAPAPTPARAHTHTHKQ